MSTDIKKTAYAAWMQVEKDRHTGGWDSAKDRVATAAENEFKGLLSLFELILFTVCRFPGNYGGELARKIVLAIIFGDIASLPAMLRETSGHTSGPSGFDDDWNAADEHERSKWLVLVAAMKAAMGCGGFATVFRRLVSLCYRKQDFASQYFASIEWQWHEDLRAMFILQPAKLAVDVYQLGGYWAQFALDGQFQFWLWGNEAPHVCLQPASLYNHLTSLYREMIVDAAPLQAFKGQYAPVNVSPYRVNDFWGWNDVGRSELFRELFGQRPVLLEIGVLVPGLVTVGLSDGTFRVFVPAEGGWIEKYCDYAGRSAERVGPIYQPEKVYTKEKVIAHLLALDPSVEKRWGDYLRTW